MSTHLMDNGRWLIFDGLLELSTKGNVVSYVRQAGLKVNEGLALELLT